MMRYCHSKFSINKRFTVVVKFLSSKHTVSFPSCFREGYFVPSTVTVVRIQPLFTQEVLF